ncbi:MAG: Holliday junction branch migration protein RuvA [Cycloclasticus sp.]|uniref:Holliday junction branch migration protein RuvA n=1 Tax=Cycloclasticus sp. TaxID=2024830 RepID=UPI00257D8F5E|nr:Holliday junction branch migration protein RuvA [Cycloclasticus sp.]MBV1898767.1 Holliday junction branch migration protein RuvA [Cycloclasticus sp.]
MIGFLRGTVDEKQAPHVVIDVNGVGYDVETPMSSFFNLPALGETVSLRTHLVVREDAHVLYGFLTEQERALFRSLIKVNGVGPKVALGILSGVSVSDFCLWVSDSNVAALVRLPGIGKKTAERLVIDMRDRLPEETVTTTSPPLGVLTQKTSAVEEAISALVALGYKPQDAEKRARAVASDDASSEQIIRSALQSAAKK